MAKAARFLASATTGATTSFFSPPSVSPNLNDVNGTDQGVIARDLRGEVSEMRIYNRALRTSEAIQNFKAGQAE